MMADILKLCIMRKVVLIVILKGRFVQIVFPV